MQKHIVGTASTSKTGNICYYVQKGTPLTVGITQQKGILLQQTVPFCGSYKKAVIFMKQLAIGKATAVSLKDLCEDYRK